MKTGLIEQNSQLLGIQVLAHLGAPDRKLKPASHALGQRLWRKLRVLSKTLSFLALTLVGAWVWLIGMAGLTFSKTAQRRWRGIVFRAWAKAMVWLFGLKLRVGGRRPRKPFLLVTNHLSYVDVIVLAAQFDCVFVAKSEIARWPLLGWLSRQMNTIFIDRQRNRDLLRVNALLSAAWAAGQNVVLFPEGTTTAGAAVLPFKSGLLEPAVRAGRSVAYASLSYRTAPDEPPAAEAVCWWGEMEFVPHLLRLFALSGFTGELVFGPEALFASDRKELAKRLQAAVEHDLARVHHPAGVALAKGLAKATVPSAVDAECIEAIGEK